MAIRLNYKRIHIYSDKRISEIIKLLVILRYVGTRTLDIDIYIFIILLYHYVLQ